MIAFSAWTSPPPRRLPMAASMGVAILLHLLLLALFLSRPISVTPPPPAPVLQIDLTPRKESAPPARPDMLAEHNQRSDEVSAPRAPDVEPMVMPQALPATPSITPAAPQKKPSPQEAPTSKPIEAKANKPALPDGKRAPAKPTEQAPQKAPSAISQQTTSLTELGLQAARLQAEILEQGLMNDITSRRKTLTANTVAGPEAAYLRAWVEKVERIGNISYPDEARRRSLSGRLVLEVVVDAWGEVQSLRVRQSSGEAVLDQAAKEIVRLAAPYAPFPPELREKYDQFTIVRTWAFVSGSGLNTR